MTYNDIQLIPAGQHWTAKGTSIVLTLSDLKLYIDTMIAHGLAMVSDNSLIIKEVTSC